VKFSIGRIGLVAAVVAVAVTPFSAAVAEGSAIPPVRGCASLAGFAVPDVGSRITSAQPVTDAALHKDYCDVKGVTAPNTRFEIKLPVSSWQGRYLQEGCSAYCGAVPAMTPPMTISGLTCAAEYTGELVVGADDEGHTAPSVNDASWGEHDPGARVVFGRTSEHSLAQVSKAVIARYYGRPPAYSYFDGCSTGGREALMLAQRYPADFDGIVAGSPAANEAPLGLLSAWLSRSNTDAAGHQIVTGEKLPALHKAVLAACGNSDGVIADPRLCGFDPATLRCPAATDTAACLTPSQVTAVGAFYRGPTDSHGRSLFNGGEPYGSELAWLGEMVQPAADTAAPGDTFASRIGLNYFKYLAFDRNPPPNFTLADVHFTDAEFYALDRLGRTLYNANNPDLRAFRAHGGKLIVYHGWADQAIPVWSTLDYYGAVERAAGGFGSSQSFSRLYLLPATYHCLFAPDGSLTTVDFVTPLMSWVEQSSAPGGITADYGPGDRTVAPADALAPVHAAPGGLNSHYDYLGKITSYLPS
jgi:hypothetical protein